MNIMERCSVCNLCVFISSSRQDSQHQTEEVKTKHNGKPEDRLLCLLKDTKAKTLKVECVMHILGNSRCIPASFQ